jgi:hypothetical protein
VGFLQHHQAVSVPLGHRQNSGFLHLVSLTSSIGHFYLALIGHFHVAVTEENTQLDAVITRE